MHETHFSRSGGSPPSPQQAALTVQQRAKLIRAATPNRDALESLYEMQNRKCDLCGFFIQDICLAALDHSTPVSHFARNLELSIADAVQQCNSPSNLRCAHDHCNHVKSTLTRDQWFAKKMNERMGEPREYTDGELLELSFRLGAGGRAAGRKMTESGCIAEIGRIQGRANVKTGHIQALGRVYGPVYGRINGRITGRKLKEQGRGIFGRTPEQHSKDSQKAGRVALESGHLARMRALPQTKVAQRQAGRKLKEDGKGIFTPGMQAVAGRIGSRVTNHIRWHLNRGIVNSNCMLCQQVAKFCLKFNFNSPTTHKF